MTGLFDASESSNPCPTALTIDGRFGRGVHQPELGFHRKGMATLLHDGGAFTVVFTHDHQCSAGNAG